MVVFNIRTLPIVLLLISPPALASPSDDPFGLARQPYEPICAHACRGAIVDNVFLSCSTTAQAGPNSTPASCYAKNSYFLQSLAICLNQRCGSDSQTNSSVNAYWNQFAVGFAAVQPAPKWQYAEALSTATNWDFNIAYGVYLDGPRQVADSDYQYQAQALASWNLAEDDHSYFALALFGCGFVMPVLFSLLRFLPISAGWSSRLYARFVYPLAMKQNWMVSLRDKNDISPTRGQAFFVLYMIVINAALSGIGHFANLDHDWTLDDRHGKFITCLSNRLGALSLANIPLVVLYAGRNNILMWLTGWSHPTFLILHRWTGYICILEAVLHSILYVAVASQEGKLGTWSMVPAWYSGAAGMVAIGIILPFALRAFWKRIYEIFLITHILLSMVALAGAYYHIYYLYSQRFSGLTLYIWIASGIWVFDRLLRLGRLSYHGVRKARITVLDRDYIRVDIPRVQAHGHVYLYFPTLTWRFWENHPFSVTNLSPPTVRASLSGVPQTPGTPGTFMSESSRYSNQNSKAKVWWREKGLPNPPSSWSPTTPTRSTGLFVFPTIQRLDEQGVTFFMRAQAGTTALLRQRRELPVLIESSYGRPERLSKYPIRLVFAGGVGITACIPYLQAHTNEIGSATRVTRLYWTSRSQNLCDQLRDETRAFEGMIAVNKRIDVTSILYKEFLEIGNHANVAVIVSGPKSMADELRLTICDLAKTRIGSTKFVDECFGW